MRAQYCAACAGGGCRMTLRRRRCDSSTSPKNGGTSIERALYVSDPGHAIVRFYDLFVPEHLARMAILRDPVDRILPQAMQRMAGIKTIDALLDFLERAGGDWLKIDTFIRPQSWYVTDIKHHIRIRHLWLIDRAAHEPHAAAKSYADPRPAAAARAHIWRRFCTIRPRESVGRLYRRVVGNAAERINLRRNTCLTESALSSD